MGFNFSSPYEKLDHFFLAGHLQSLLRDNKDWLTFQSYQNCPGWREKFNNTPQLARRENAPGRPGKTTQQFSPMDCYSNPPLRRNLARQICPFAMSPVDQFKPGKDIRTSERIDIKLCIIDWSNKIQDKCPLPATAWGEGTLNSSRLLCTN
jgi:hypothetical protein